MTKIVKLRRGTTVQLSTYAGPVGELLVDSTTNELVLQYGTNGGYRIPRSGSSISFTNLTYTGTLTGGTSAINIGSGQIVKTTGGNVLLGTATDSGYKLDVFDSSISQISASRTGGQRVILGTDSSTGAYTGTIDNSDFKILSNSLEGAKLTTARYFKVSNTGTYTDAAGTDRNTTNNHLFVSNQADSTVIATNSNTASSAANTFGSIVASGFLGTHYAAVVQGSGIVCQILANGTVQNSTGLYQSISDRRVKSNIQPLTGSGEFIDALQPRTWQWTEDAPRTGFGAGFIADEFQEVCPDAVTGDENAVDDNGDPVYQAIDPSTAEVIANLVAEIQSLRIRVAALEA